MFFSCIGSTYKYYEEHLKDNILRFPVNTIHNYTPQKIWSTNCVLTTQQTNVFSIFFFNLRILDNIYVQSFCIQYMSVARDHFKRRYYMIVRVLMGRDLEGPSSLVTCPCFLRIQMQCKSLCGVLALLAYGFNTELLQPSG